jgi:1,4-dihydroxy-2-naphthoate octaprenyltransferase
MDSAKSDKTLAIILAFRPKTLTAAVVPIVAGTCLLKALSLPILWWISGLALAASLFIQIGTNLVNDASDFKKGADTEGRIGPQRITQAGVLSYRQVMTLATLCFAIAVLCGIPLVMAGGLPIILIGIASVLCGYAYTAGPFPLAYKGLGDVFVILFFGIIAVMGLVFLQTQQWRPEALVLGLQVGLHCTVLIAINNLRDIEGDRVVGKRTLPVRFGKTFARAEIALLCTLPFLLLPYWWSIGLSPYCALSLLALPLAVTLIKSVFQTEPSPVYNKFLGKAAGLHLIFAVLLSIGFIL